MIQYFDKIFVEGDKAFETILQKDIREDHKRFIITANPETLMTGMNNHKFDSILKREDVCIVPDGIGIVKAGQYLGYPIKERVTGVGIAEKILRIINSEQKSLYLFGAQNEVLTKLVSRIKTQFPNIEVCGYCDGYVQNKKEVFEEIIQKKPDAVLVALGIPAQELLIGEFIDRFDKGIFVGVGGSFDVLSGCKKRAPEIFIKLNLEWLYRILKEPKRLSRFFKSNCKFIFHIVSLKRKIKKAAI